MAKINTYSLYCGQYAFEEDYLTKYLICRVCDMVFKNPTRLHRCGHTFCQKCVPNDGKCADCFMPFETKQPDLIAANLVGDSYVRCLARECPYRGVYQQYQSLHKNSCKMKNHQGVHSWMQKVKQSLEEPPPRSRQNHRITTIDCEQIEILETVKPRDQKSILIQQQSRFNQYSELQSVVIDNKSHRRIEIDSLYFVNPENQKIVEKQAQQKPAYGRKCRYGRHCRLQREGACPYIHPSRDPRRNYELDSWDQTRIQRPQNQVIPDHTQLRLQQKQDTLQFVKDFFPGNKPSDDWGVKIISHKRPKNKKQVIQL